MENGALTAHAGSKRCDQKDINLTWYQRRTTLVQRQTDVFYIRDCVDRVGRDRIEISIGAYLLRQNAVSAYFASEQISVLRFVFAQQRVKGADC